MPNRIHSVLKKIDKQKYKHKTNVMQAGFYLDPLLDEINELRSVTQSSTYLSFEFQWPLDNDDDDLCGTDEMINMEKHYLQTQVFLFISFLYIITFL
jgi:hypothetical protein